MSHETKVCRRHPGKLVDHTDCYHELKRIEAERDELRKKLAELRAEYIRATVTVPCENAAAGEWR
jgi:uncharacterized protein YfcZ (UPF0381/DUF406 family)